MSQQLRWLKRMHLRPVIFQDELRIAVGEVQQGSLYLHKGNGAQVITFKERGKIIPFTDEQLAEEICFKSYIAIYREELRKRYPDIFWVPHHMKRGKNYVRRG